MSFTPTVCILRPIQTSSPFHSTSKQICICYCFHFKIALFFLSFEFVTFALLAQIADYNIESCDIFLLCGQRQFIYITCIFRGSLHNVCVNIIFVFFFVHLRLCNMFKTLTFFGNCYHHVSGVVRQPEHGSQSASRNKE